MILKTGFNSTLTVEGCKSFSNDYYISKTNENNALSETMNTLISEMFICYMLKVVSK
jgi:hypothetical protein